jgi:hypothetical protein
LWIFRMVAGARALVVAILARPQVDVEALEVERAE